MQRNKGRLSRPARTPSVAPSNSVSAASQYGRRGLSSPSHLTYTPPHPSPPIFSSPVPNTHSRQELARHLGSHARSSASITSNTALRSTPSLPQYPQARAGRLSLPSQSSVTSVIPSTGRSHGDRHNGHSPDTDSAEDEPEAMDEVIMAVDMKDNGTIGCAYYVALDEALFIQEDIPTAGIDFVEMLLMRVEPTTVLTSIRGSDSLIEFLEAGAQDFGGNREGISHCCSTYPRC